MIKCKRCGKDKTGTYKYYCNNCYWHIKYHTSKKWREHRKKYSREYSRTHKELTRNSQKKWLDKNPHYHRDYFRRVRKTPESKWR